jgi:hypothetical protein
MWRQALGKLQHPLSTDAELGRNYCDLFNRVGAGLADRRVLIAGAATATDRVDKLGAFDVSRRFCAPSMRRK